MTTADENKEVTTIDTTGSHPSSSAKAAKTVAQVVGGIALLANVAVLASLPPVLRGKGAPYLPTFRKQSDAMFAKLRRDPDFAALASLRRQPHNSVTSARRPVARFVDLGSGDGRMVFRAAREPGMFDEAVGYEINPFLHAFAQVRKFILQPSQYASKTSFRCANLWDVDLSTDANPEITTVVAVYGLGPIMNDLGIKLRKELKPGSFVISNVFSFPGWTPVTGPALQSQREQEVNAYLNAHLYKTPECWGENK